jgi:hypothetical protein
LFSFKRLPTTAPKGTRQIIARKKKKTNPKYKERKEKKKKMRQIGQKHGRVNQGLLQFWMVGIATLASFRWI